jgi:hypothetical protein
MVVACCFILAVSLVRVRGSERACYSITIGLPIQTRAVSRFMSGGFGVSGHPKRKFGSVTLSLPSAYLSMRISPP